MKSTKQVQLKKRLFILAGYLFITAILLVYLSYSSYKIKIESTVLMPKTYSMSASLEAYHNDEDTVEGTETLADQSAMSLKGEAEVELENYNALVGLAPGTDAKTYALESGDDIKETHRFTVKVDNKNDGDVSPSALDLYYTLEVETNGRLPLSFVLKEDNAITASAIVDCTENEETTKAAFVNPTTGKKVLFKLEGGEYNENSHEFYIGWNDASEKANDIDLCREVDKITIRAKIYAGVPTYTDKFEDTTSLPAIVYFQEEIVPAE